MTMAPRLCVPPIAPLAITFPVPAVKVRLKFVADRLSAVLWNVIVPNPVPPVERLTLVVSVIALLK